MDKEQGEDTGPERQPLHQHQQQHHHHVDYTSQGGPCLSYLSSDNDNDNDFHELAGSCTFRYSGAVLGIGSSDSNIYCIPNQATRVLKIDTSTHTVQSIGPTWTGNYKWMQGVASGDVIYGFPCHADTVLRIHVPTGEVTTLDIPYEEAYRDKQVDIQRQMTWKYRCGAISPSDGCIYAIPQSAWHILKINPTTDSVELLVSYPAEPGRYKWNACVVGKDGAIYGIPHSHLSVLRIQPLSQDNVVTLHGSYRGTNKWEGGTTSTDGTIVCAPANAETVLCIVPQEPPILEEMEHTHVIQSGRHRVDGKLKYAGLTTGQDGMVYAIPNCSEYVIQVDATNKRVTKVGPNLVDTKMEKILHNKWRNGHCCGDTFIYAIPQSSETLLQIDTQKSSPEVSTWLLPSPCKGSAKWEGGIVTKSGIMYCIPNNHKDILRISPISLPLPGIFKEDMKNSTSMEKNNTVLSKGKENTLLYNTGIPTLRSSAHRVKYTSEAEMDAPKEQFAKETAMLWLPKVIRGEHVLDYDLKEYDFPAAIASILDQCAHELVGSFPSTTKQQYLHDFCLPPQSLNRGDYGGHCEAAQSYLSGQLYANGPFLDLFDRFVNDVVLPYFKRRMIEGNVILEGEKCTFFCQRPPTLRLQPGPARAFVNTHHDAKYGHQNGELNFWLPLTDRDLTKVDLFAESSHMKGDFHPLIVNPGQVISFHGTSCRHYVNANSTPYTRVSLDFRIGVEGFYDPHWVMPGTTCDHDRKIFKL